MLGKAWWHTTEQDETRPRWDVVLLDAPATGHGLTWLRLPVQMRDMFASGPIHDLAARIVDRLVAPSRCSVVVVTLPEEMPTTETVELAATLEEELGLHVRHVVVNQVLPPLFSQGERATLDGLGELAVTDAGSAALRSARHRAVRERVQAESLARLAKSLPGPPKTYLPLLFEDAAAPSAIKELAKRL